MNGHGRDLIGLRAQLEAMEKEDATLAADIEAIAETRRLRSRISIVQESIERRKKEYAELTRPTAQAAEAMGA